MIPLRLLLVLALLLPISARPETMILEGSHRVVLDIINPAGIKKIPDYQNANFRQRVIETKPWTARVEITISLEPFRSQAGFPLADYEIPAQWRAFLKPEKEVQSHRPEIQQLSRELTGYATTELDAVTRVAHWMADNIRYEVNTPQDAFSVYRNRAGSCAGQTRLMMALLRAAGIPARYARGFLPPGGQWGFDKEYWGVSIKSGGFHAWIEIFYPDQGWVFSDILHSLNFVDPHHLLFQIAGTDLNPTYETTVSGEDGNIRMEEGTSWTIFSEDDQSRVVDGRPEPKRPLLSLRAGPQTSCAVYGVVKDAAGRPVKSGSLIVWEGEQGKGYPLDRKGRFGVGGLDCQNYGISVRAEGFAEAKKSVTFVRPEAKELNFVLEPGGVIYGRVTDAAGRGISGIYVYLWQGGKGKGYPTDEDGNYKVIGCSAGAQSLSVEAPGYKRAEAKVEVKPGARVEKNFVLSPAR